MALTEDLPLLPESFYGVTKFASEGITKRYGELHDLETVSVRLSSPYGPMERAHGLPHQDGNVVRLDEERCARGADTRPY